MSRNRKPICFIAMAFGREDTDLFYENLILPILKKNNITAIIINRRISNDDLNIQIIEQLERADFCIADLTYARPSVYFEAGFAQRSIPVIYTVRKDHLLEGQPEDLRVHFDLKMKPIIDWENPNDSTFSNRLERRLRSTILSDWLRKNNKQTKYEDAIKKFEELPLSDRLALLQRRGIYSMRRAGVSLSKWRVVKTFDYPANTTTNYSMLIRGKLQHVMATNIENKSARSISIQTYESVYKKDLAQLYSVYFVHRFLGPMPIKVFAVDDPEKYNNVSSFFTDVIVLSLKPIPKNRIEGTLRDATVIEPSKCYYEENNDSVYRRNSFKHITRNMIIRIHFISGIKSDLHLKQELDNLIDEYLINIA